MSPISVLILFVVGVFLALGDFFMKEWSFGGVHALKWYAGAIFLYVISLSVYGYMLRNTDFAAASFSILLFNMIAVAVAGYMFFGDHMSLLEFLGIVSGIASVIFFATSTS